MQNTFQLVSLKITIWMCFKGYGAGVMNIVCTSPAHFMKLR